MPTLERLAIDGHEVVLRTIASARNEGTVPGIEIGPVHADLERCQPDDWRSRTRAGAMRRAVKVFARRAWLEIDDAKSAIAETAPDVVVVDVACWGAAAVAEEWGGPWAQFTPYILPIRTKERPPAGFGLSPGTGVRYAARDRIVWSLIDAWTKILLPPLNDIRHHVGVDPLRHVTEIFSRSRVTLSYTSSLIEPIPADWPPSIRQVGFAPWTPRTKPSALSAVPGNRPIILVTTSSVFQRDDALATAARALLENDRKFFTIITVPARTSRARRYGSSVLEAAFVPHQPILDSRAVCCVLCHGGAGITQRALAEGVPVCAVPFGRDQFEVARRIDLARVGVSFSRRRLASPRALRAALERTMERRAEAERARPNVREGSSPRGAAELILAVARERGREWSPV